MTTPVCRGSPPAGTALSTGFRARYSPGLWISVTKGSPIQGSCCAPLLCRLRRGRAEPPGRAVCGRCRDFTLARPLRVQETASLVSSPVRTRAGALTPVASPLMLRVTAVRNPPSARLRCGLVAAPEHSAFRRAVIQSRHRPELLTTLTAEISDEYSHP
ncbi:hypothetical protein JOJ88_006092 [Pantoea cypripedii]|nr:hypothetical protein [Pantoea cypripedii]